MSHNPYHQLNSRDEQNRVGMDLQAKEVARATAPYVEPAQLVSECQALMHETYWNNTVSELVSVKKHFLTTAFTRAPDDVLAFRKRFAASMDAQIEEARAGARAERDKYEALRSARS